MKTFAVLTGGIILGATLATMAIGKVVLPVIDTEKAANTIVRAQRKIVTKVFGLPEESQVDFKYRRSSVYGIKESQ